MSKIAVEIQDLTVAYHDKPVLWDVDLNIHEGTIMAIVGPNGAGKSTLIKSALELIPSSSGRALFYGKSYRSQRKQIAYVPQSGSVDWDFPTSVLDVVVMGTYGKLGWVRRPGKTERSAAKEALKKVGMLEYADRQISMLSGGQQQRVFIARALVQDARIYFLDEPLKGVDIKTEQVIMGLLNELKQQGKTVVVVHHDLRTVPTYFDEVCLLNVQVTATGKVAEVFTEEHINRTYRGEWMVTD